MPKDAVLGFTRMRILVDGDGYNGGATPPFDLCGKIGYAGSMHDYGITIAGSTNFKEEPQIGVHAFFDSISLVVNGVEAGAMVSLFDLSGNVVIKNVATGSSFVVNTAFNRGGYILRIKNGTHVSTLKLMK